MEVNCSYPLVVMGRNDNDERVEQLDAPSRSLSQESDNLNSCEVKALLRVVDDLIQCGFTPAIVGDEDVWSRPSVRIS